jgi:hypothetical protein
MAVPFQQTFLRKGHPRKVIGLALTFSTPGDTEIVMSQRRFRRVSVVYCLFGSTMFVRDR